MSYRSRIGVATSLCGSGEGGSGGLVDWVDGQMEGWYFVFSSNCIYTYVCGFCWHFLFFFCSVVVIVVLDVVIVVVFIIVVVVVVIVVVAI